MSNVNDGGPAFPYFFPERDEEIGTLPCAYQPGMTLRAYFAGQAMAGMELNNGFQYVPPEWDSGVPQYHAEKVAKMCRIYADALIEELNR